MARKIMYNQMSYKDKLDIAGKYRQTEVVDNNVVLKGENEIIFPISNVIIFNHKYYNMPYKLGPSDFVEADSMSEVVSIRSGNILHIFNKTWEPNPNALLADRIYKRLNTFLLPLSGTYFMKEYSDDKMIFLEVSGNYRVIQKDKLNITGKYNKDMWFEVNAETYASKYNINVLYPATCTLKEYMYATVD